MPLGDRALDRRSVAKRLGLGTGGEIHRTERLGDVGEEARQMILQLRLGESPCAGDGQLAPEPGDAPVEDPLQPVQNGVTDPAQDPDAPL